MLLRFTDTEGEAIDRLRAEVVRVLLAAVNPAIAEGAELCLLAEIMGVDLEGRDP